MGLFKLNKRKIKPLKDEEEKKKLECNEDPDCPMCHVSDEVVSQLTEDKE